MMLMIAVIVMIAMMIMMMIAIMMKNLMLEDFNVMSHNLMTMLIAIDSNDNEFNARRFHGDVVEPELDDYDKYDHEEFEVMRFQCHDESLITAFIQAYTGWLFAVFAI